MTSPLGFKARVDPLSYNIFILIRSLLGTIYMCISFKLLTVIVDGTVTDGEGAAECGEY